VGLEDLLAIPGFLAVPALLISSFAQDTPIYHIEMKKVSRKRTKFTKTRGKIIDFEFEQLIKEGQGALSLLKHVFSRQCRPCLVINCVREICM